MGTRVYILSEQMRSNRSPYTVQGTDIVQDIPALYPLPNRCTVNEKNGPEELRYLPNSKYITIREQMKHENRTMNEKFDDIDRKKLTFYYGRLELDEVNDAMAIKFLDKSGWNAANHATRTDRTKVIYESYDENKFIDAQLSTEEQIAIAKGKVMALTTDQLRGLYMLSVDGFNAEHNIQPGKMKLHLLKVAEKNPEFIVAQITDARDAMTVLVGKAIEYQLLNMGTNGYVTIQSPYNAQEMQMFFETPEHGGVAGKFQRTVDYLLTDEGKSQAAILKDRVTQYEASRK